ELSTDVAGNVENAMHGSKSSQAMAKDRVGNSGCFVSGRTMSRWITTAIVRAIIVTSNTSTLRRPGGTSALANGKPTIRARKTKRSGSLRVQATSAAPPTAAAIAT